MNSLGDGSLATTIAGRVGPRTSTSTTPRIGSGTSTQRVAPAKRIVAERTAYLVSFLRKHPCVDCGEDDPVVLEFDHLRDKEFSIGKGMRDRPWKRVLAEMDKCEVVCANCHRRQTNRRGGFIRTIVIADTAGDDRGRA
jgi:hypothetical protein